MARFRKKPVEIEAWRFGPDPFEPYPPWLADAIAGGTVFWQGGADAHFTVRTLEGNMRADRGDWIIRGVAGELYPCKPDIFEKTYEPVAH